MKLRSVGILVLIAAAVLPCGCAEPVVDRLDAGVPPTPRRMAIWLDADGIDAETSRRLHEAGVDQLVIRRGAIELQGAAPVVRLVPEPPVEGTIPTAASFLVRGLGSSVADEAAEALWGVLERDFGDRPPTELLLDLPEIGPATGEFLAALARRSGLAVVPILSISQLQTETGRGVAAATHRCMIPVYGVQDQDLRGLADLNTQPLSERLLPVRDLGIRVRLGVALRSKTDPPVAGWAEDLDVLTEGDTAEVKRSSPLDRSFVVREPLSWSGADVAAGRTIDVAWVDVPRLGLLLAESHRMVLPELDGWDLVSLPPGDGNLGLDREELVRYLGGEGPGPAVEVSLQRRGRLLTVQMSNRSAFRSAVTTYGNWIQIELASGALVASSRGRFDRVILGSVRGGDWEANPTGRPDAVRFVETYVAPGEEIVTGSIRLPSSRSRVVVRWQVQLSDGTTVGGVAD